MSALKIYAFLVLPGKNEVHPAVPTGNKVPLSGKLYDLLSAIFYSNGSDKDFGITFRRDSNGQQNNDCRTLIQNFQKRPNKSTAQAIAQRLSLVSDKRPGIGLLFIMSGQHGTKHRVVISRFPAHEAIMAEVNKNSLDVSYLEQVFIKKMTAYKAVMLEDRNPAAGFWKGIATDRQAGTQPSNMSDYWIDDFLNADFTETPEAGTRRLAEALKKAVKVTPNLAVKSEITSAITLAPNALRGQKISIDIFCKHFGLSDHAKQTIVAALDKPSLSSKVFVFDPTEFTKRVPYRTVEMDTGATLTAPTDEFSDLFRTRPLANGEVEYTTRGTVQDERLTRR